MECMYLHDIADQEASFTKTEMNTGKHTEYENELLENFKRREQDKQARHLGNKILQKAVGGKSLKKQTSNTPTAAGPPTTFNKQTSLSNGDSSPIAKKRTTEKPVESENPWGSGVSKPLRSVF